MQSINNLAGAAQKAIFGSNVTAGEGGEEPVAGVQGAGTANDPFDKGNDTTATDNNDQNEPSNAQPADTTGDPSSGTTDNVGSDNNQGANAPLKEDKPTGEIGKKNADGSVNVPHTDEEREEAMLKGEFPHDPNDHSGEPLHMHGESKGGDVGEGKTDRSASVAQEGGDPHGEEKKGDGTQYVKSSGVAADGGDFDATAPGAGSEANRLLEEKGVHKAAAPAATDDDTSSPAPADDPTGKPSKLQKIKDKLHIK